MKLILARTVKLQTIENLNFHLNYVKVQVFRLTKKFSFTSKIIINL